jgi:predicted nucleotidyltransferase
MASKDEILSLIRNHKSELAGYGIRGIGLFGSYLRNEQTDFSDIDILIDFEPEKESFDNYMAVYDFLERLFAGKKVEVLTKNGLSPYIGPKILTEVVYA